MGIMHKLVPPPSFLSIASAPWASMHQTEKPLKSAIGQKGPHPPYSSLKQAAQKQLTTKKKEGRERS